MNIATATSRQLTCQVFVRTNQPSRFLDATVSALNGLVEDGQLDRIKIEGWPDEIRLDRSDIRVSAIEPFRQIQSWAEVHGVSVQPPFVIEDQYCPVTDDHSCLLRTPAICLCLFDEEHLVHAYPYTSEGETHSVMDGIAQMKADQLEYELVEGDPDPEPPRRCTSCGDELLHVHGIGVCRTCSGATVGAKV